MCIQKLPCRGHVQHAPVVVPQIKLISCIIMTLERAFILLHLYMQVYESHAYPPESIVDTLGAGDTFNAGIIHSLSRGRSVSEALQYACKLAGTKCGMVGFDGLKNFDPSWNLQAHSTKIIITKTTIVVSCMIVCDLMFSVLFTSEIFFCLCPFAFSAR